jgi:2,3-bisphosphoglycerate-dependent phosphoglycerate mutase
MTILFIRHGETALNTARTLQPANTPLSANGLAQAQAVANRLATLGIVHILSSDLPRALQTAQAIASATGAPIETSPLLHERNFGDLRGQPYDALGFDPLQAEDAPPGGESGQAFRERVALAFAQAVHRRSGLAGRLAVVTHGLVIRAVIQRHLQLGTDQALPTPVRNTSVTIVTTQAPHRAELLDCTRHLDAGSRHDERSLSGG